MQLIAPGKPGRNPYVCGNVPMLPSSFTYKCPAYQYYEFPLILPGLGVTGKSVDLESLRVPFRDCGAFYPFFDLVDLVIAAGYAEIFQISCYAPPNNILDLNPIDPSTRLGAANAYTYRWSQTWDFYRNFYRSADLPTSGSGTGSGSSTAVSYSTTAEVRKTIATVSTREDAIGMLVDPYTTIPTI